MSKSLFLIILMTSYSIHSAEMIVGEEKMEPGIDLIFEAAPKDIVHPKEYFRAESNTDIHIEMLANWSEDSPNGSPVGGFVAYLNVFVKIKAENGTEVQVQLTPHLNMSDSLHYAQNIKLPGKIDELYDVTFTISPPIKDELGIHYDWNELFGPLMEKSVFTYKNLNFEQIALSSRR